MHRSSGLFKSTNRDFLFYFMENEDCLKFLIAHELAHVFDMLRLIIPAFKNWKGFWRNVLMREMIAQPPICSISGIQFF